MRMFSKKQPGALVISCKGNPSRLVSRCFNALLNLSTPTKVEGGVNELVLCQEIPNAQSTPQIINCSHAGTVRDRSKDYMEG